MFRLLLLTTVVNVVKVDCKLSTATTMSAASAAAAAIHALDFEVYGRVQGVFFRKYTKDQADKLGIRGWCRNTHQGTVVGQLEGPNEQIESMMHWLKNTGSPSSQIDKAEFRNIKDVAEYSFKDFVIRK